MPLYEFKCEKCETITERLCSVGSNGKGLKCPHCGGSKLRRLMSVFSARVKGESGGTRARSGSGCSSCAGGNCATCH